MRNFDPMGGQARWSRRLETERDKVLPTTRTESRSSAMTVRADNLALRDFLKDRRPCTGRGIDCSRDLEAFPTAGEVIEVEHHGVLLTAITARVLSEILDHQGEVLMPVPRLHRVQAISGARHGRSLQVAEGRDGVVGSPEFPDQAEGACCKVQPLSPIPKP